MRFTDHGIILRFQHVGCTCNLHLAVDSIGIAVFHELIYKFLEWLPIRSSIFRFSKQQQQQGDVTSPVCGL